MSGPGRSSWYSVAPSSPDRQRHGQWRGSRANFYGGLGELFQLRLRAASAVSTFRIICCREPLFISKTSRCLALASVKLQSNFSRSVCDRFLTLRTAQLQGEILDTAGYWTTELFSSRLRTARACLAERSRSTGTGPYLHFLLLTEHSVYVARISLMFYCEPWLTVS
jgi:hypothetical protein